MSLQPKFEATTYHRVYFTEQKWTLDNKWYKLEILYMVICILQNKMLIYRNSNSSLFSLFTLYIFCQVTYRKRFVSWKKKNYVHSSDLRFQVTLCQDLSYKFWVWCITYTFYRQGSHRFESDVKDTIQTSYVSCFEDK